MQSWVYNDAPDRREIAGCRILKTSTKVGRISRRHFGKSNSLISPSSIMFCVGSDHTRPQGYPAAGGGSLHRQGQGSGAETAGPPSFPDLSRRKDLERNRSALSRSSLPLCPCDLKIHDSVARQTRALYHRSASQHHGSLQLQVRLLPHGERRRAIR